jgi:hypothetical protein
LFAIRSPSIVLGSLSCVFTYLLASTLVQDEPIAVLAGFFLAINPAFIGWTSLAMLESGVAFFFLGSVETYVLGMENSSLFYIILSALFAGLAYGSRETSLVLPFVLGPYTFVVLGQSAASMGLATASGTLELFVAWLALSLLVFYITWPFLWSSPVKQFLRNLRTVREMGSATAESSGFYITRLLALWPTVFAIPFGVTVSQLLGWKTFVQLIIPLSWVLIPLILMSTPYVTKRGGHVLTFLLPPLAILAAFGAWSLPKVLTYFIPLAIASQDLLRLVGSTGLILVLFLESLRIHPYHLQYSGTSGKIFSKEMWGEGMRSAIEYIDQHAPVNSTVWIYGPKSTALYHSKRVNVQRTLETQPFFYARAKEFGSEVQMETEFYTWRTGDLKFEFPYYEEKVNINKAALSYVLLYRWATLEEGYAQMSASNRRIISDLLTKQKPVFVARLKNEEVCFVYDANRLDPKQTPRADE